MFALVILETGFSSQVREQLAAVQNMNLSSCCQFAKHAVIIPADFFS